MQKNDRLSRDDGDPVDCRRYRRVREVYYGYCQNRRYPINLCRNDIYKQTLSVERLHELSGEPAVRLPNALARGVALT